MSHVEKGTGYICSGPQKDNHKRTLIRVMNRGQISQDLSLGRAYFSFFRIRQCPSLSIPTVNWMSQSMLFMCCRADYFPQSKMSYQKHTVKTAERAEELMDCPVEHSFLKISKKKPIIKGTVVYPWLLKQKVMMSVYGGEDSCYP
jgi:hypothetical protein